MIQIVMQWNGQEVSKALEDEAWRLLMLATNIVRNHAIALCSKPAKRIRVRRTRDTSRGKKGSQYTIFRGSRPGEPPQVRRGFGRKSIDMELSRESLTTQLGVRRNAAYMAYLEVGTGRIRPRPWLLPALEMSQGQLRALRIR
jgi:hypothetical protein